MKKFILGFVLLLISSLQVSALSCIDLKNNLTRGKENDEVLALQNFLSEKGFLTAKPNGYFGAGTLAAVKKYQQSIGLSRSGQVFPLTRAAIKKETCIGVSTPTTVSNTNTNTTSTTNTQNTSTTNITPTLAATYLVGTNPYGVSFSSSTNSIWVANYGSANVTKMDASTGDVLGTYSVGINPVEFVQDPSTNSIWVANRGSNSVTRINISTGEIMGNYTVGVNPIYLTLDTSTRSIWVANRGSNTVTKINASTGAVIGTYTVGGTPIGIAFDSSTNSIWVANNSSSSVTKLSASSGSITGTYTVGSFPSGVAFDSFTKSVWVTNFGSSSVSKINSSNGSVIGIYNVGNSPTGITFDPYTNSIWTANRTSNSVTKLNASNGATVGTYTVGTNPNGIAVNSNSVWVSNYTSNNVMKFITKKVTTESTTTNTSTTQPKPTITSVGSATFISGSTMNAPITIRGTGFSSSSNIILFKLQNSQKVYTIGSFSSLDGITINASSSFTIKEVSCGNSCSELVQPGNYDVVVKNQGGESNTGYISIKSVTTQTTPNSPDASFIPKSTHVKLATVSLSSSVPVSLKALNLHLVASSTLATKVSNLTLTDLLADKIINGGPAFVFTDQNLTDNQSKIYELYANIGDITDGKGGQVYFSGEFVVRDYIGNNDISVPIKPFLISISY